MDGDAYLPLIGKVVILTRRYVPGTCLVVSTVVPYLLVLFALRQKPCSPTHSITTNHALLTRPARSLFVFELGNSKENMARQIRREVPAVSKFKGFLATVLSLL